MHTYTNKQIQESKSLPHFQTAALGSSDTDVYVFVYLRVVYNTMLCYVFHITL